MAKYLKAYQGSQTPGGDPYAELANAIILRAVYDYFIPNQHIDAKNFFTSGWYELMTGLDYKTIIKRYGEENHMRVWHYCGPVSHFDKVVAWNWDRYTTAPNKGRALSNLASRYKKENKLEQNTRIKLEEAFIVEEQLI